jgi:hypothetical protein
MLRRPTRCSHSKLPTFTMLNVDLHKFDSSQREIALSWRISGARDRLPTAAAAISLHRCKTCVAKS